MKKTLLNYINSPSTQYGYFIGFIMFLSYAYPRQAFCNITLISICTFIGFAIPFYSKFSNKIEEFTNLKSGYVSAGRAARYLVQLIFNLFIFILLVKANILDTFKIESLGGVLGISLLTTGVSLGIQSLMLMLSNREIGDRNRNVLIGLSFNIIITALATLGFVWIKDLFYFLGIFLGFFIITLGVISDLRSIFSPKSGVGIYIGTFNPFHKTHLKIILDVMEKRKLEKVYLHCTDIPKLHLKALEKNEIKIEARVNGMRVYKKSKTADVNANYFPTGNQFFEYDTRVLFMKEAIKSVNLENKIVVLSEPEIYRKNGFYGIVNFVKKINPKVSLHGIHGSDLGGMLCRNIYDESGWIYPYSVRRIDGVSATLIRQGTTGMTVSIIDKIIYFLTINSERFEIDGKIFIQKEGVVKYA